MTQGRRPSTDLVPYEPGEGGGSGATGKRAMRILQQKLPGLPSKGDMLETALVVGGLGVAGMYAWPYVVWMLSIPLMMLKVGLAGGAIYGAWWVWSRLPGGAPDPDDGDDEDP